jgi:hypothetical protein
LHHTSYKQLKTQENFMRVVFASGNCGNQATNAIWLENSVNTILT